LLKSIFYKRPSLLQTNFAFKYTRIIAFIPVFGMVMCNEKNFTKMSLKLYRVMIFLLFFNLKRLFNVIFFGFRKEDRAFLAESILPIAQLDRYCCRHAEPIESRSEKNIERTETTKSLRKIRR
jgi:hypothetical protein